MSNRPDRAPTVVDVLKRQLEPTLEMLGHIIARCPDDLWAADDAQPPIWQQCYHVLVGLDVWLNEPGSAPALPSFHTEAAGRLEKDASPELTHAQIEGYCEQVYAKCARVFEGLTPPMLLEEKEIRGKRFTLADRILGQIRHVQHHVGAMNALLRRETGTAPDWVGFNE